jgi:hypothetical protein
MEPERLLELEDINLLVNCLKGLLKQKESSLRNLIENYLRFQLDTAINNYNMFDSEAEWNSYRQKLYDFIYKNDKSISDM